MPEDLKQTPLYDLHREQGARLVGFAGYAMPLQYRGITAEHHAVRERAGLFDVSHMGELELRGEHAARVVNRLVTNDLDRIEPGQAMYTCCCNATGGVLDDLIVYRRGPDDLLVVCNASNHDKIAAHFQAAAAAEPGCDYTDRSDETSLLALQGPRALAILTRAGIDGVDGIESSLGPFRLRQTTVAGVRCTVARTGYTGEDGVELFCSNDGAATLYRALLEAGAVEGLEPVGLGARDTLRLEARLSLYGNEIDEGTNPLEAGLGWTVKLGKAEFIGQEALSRIQREGLTRKLVGFAMTGRGIARHGYRLLDESGAAVGVCTSGAPSPTLRKAIGLGYLPIALTGVGTRFLVDCRGKSVPAEVVKTPFYKRSPSG